MDRYAGSQFLKIMKLTHHPLALVFAATFVLAAGAKNPVGSSKLATPLGEAEPFGQMTLGAKFSDGLQSGYVDVVSGLAVSRDGALFLSARGTTDDSSQQLGSIGLGYRFLLANPGVIFGANVFYDYVDSAHGNGFNQLGLGAEVLSKWVDARFNYYLPEDKQVAIGRLSRTVRNRSAGEVYQNGSLLQQDTTTHTRTRQFSIFETGREGWNAEVGFLVPGLERYVDLRLFAGAYGYDDARGGTTSGFKGRAEARVTDGLTFDVEYWEDAELVGGHWVGEVRVSVPFDIGNLFAGKNPFAGAENIFRRTPNRGLQSRMDEMVIRSHRVQTTASDPVLTNTTTKSTKTTQVTGHKVMPPMTVAPPSSSIEVVDGVTEVNPEQPK